MITRRKALRQKLAQASLLFLLFAPMLACSGNAGDNGASIFALFTTPQAYSIDAGQAIPITVSIVNDSTPGGATFSVTGSGSLLAPTSVYVGSTEKVTAIYTAPSSVVSTTTATVTATSVYTPAQSVSVVLTIAPALTISTLTLPSGTASTAYNTTLATSGGTGALTWSLALGTLPTGITLDPIAGSLSGTPTTAGTYTFTIGVKDSSAISATAVQTFNLTISPPLPVITTTTLPSGVTGAPYSQQLTYTGGGNGTPVWAISSGSLPNTSGVALSSSGLISGTPLVAGTTYTFSVTVTIGTQTSAPVSLSFVAYAPVVITTTSLPSGRAYVAYSQQLHLTGGNGGTQSWAITSGSLPSSSGLTLSSTGLISGTPTTVATYNFFVTATVGTQTSAAQAYTLSVTSTVITSGNTAVGEVGLPFAFQLTAVGGTLPYTWSVLNTGTALPTGLSLNTSTGLISGTPTTTTGSPFTNIVVQASDAHSSSASQAITITINAARGTANNAALKGQYAFLLSGFDATGHPLATAGTFTADGSGHITTGVMDTNSTALAAAVTNAALTATTYNVGSDDRGQLTLTTTAGTTAYVISLNSLSSSMTGGIASSGTMTEFDSTGQSLTGTLALQSTAAFNVSSITGGFAFGLTGFAANSGATLAHSASIGELQTNGTATLSSAELLLSSTGSTTPIVPTSGALTIASNGRGTLSLVLPSGTMNLVVYVVSAGKLFLLSSDPATGITSATRDLLSGQGLAQTTSNGSFGAASLSGTSVFRTQDLVTAAGPTYYPDVQIGLYTFNGSGKLTVASDEDAGGTDTADSLYGTYTIATNGRVTAYLMPTGVGGCLDCGKVPTFFYLVGTNQGFVMDFTSTLTSGYFEPQTLSSFTAVSFSGSYSTGTLQPLIPTVIDQSGYLTADGAGNVTGKSDQNSSGTLTPDVALSTTYTVSATGRVALATNGPILYIISATKALYLDLSSAAPVVQEVLHQ